MEWKSLVSDKLESLELQLRLPQDWDVEVRRGASGMPCVVAASPGLGRAPEAALPRGAEGP